MTINDPTVPDPDRTRMTPVGLPGTDTPDPAIGAQNALPPGTVMEEFELVSAIGQGGFSIVYLANDVALQRKVAIKEYLPRELAIRRPDYSVSPIAERYADTFQAGLRSFIKEAKLLAHFDNPSLVKVYRFWRANGTAYMAMQYYEGATLEEALRRLGHPPDEPWLKAILAQIMDALEVLHAEQWLHRDIAPDNILLLPGDRPVLIDLGAARQAISNMDQKMTVILKPGYAPIEQFTGAASLKQGPWTDCYALAAVVYYAITGSAPASAAMRVVRDPVVPLARGAAGQYSEQFLRVIDAALAVQPGDRPQSVAEFRRLLGLYGTSTAADGQADKRPWWKRGIAAVVVAIAVALAALAAMLLSDREGPKVPPMPPQVAPRPFQPTDVTDAIYAGRDPAWAVIALPSAQRARIGKDLLRFTVQSQKPGYLYILMLDTTQSRLYLLFPNKGDAENVIEPRKPIDLPRPGWTMTPDGPAGIDRFLVVVTEQPHQFAPPLWQPAGSFQELPLAKAKALFGTPGWSAKAFMGSPVCPRPATGDCFKPYGAAQFAIEEIDATAPASK